MEQNIVSNNFEQLAGNIINVQDALQAQAAHAVNLALTSRNWLIGYYIVEYEQHGADRAQYGEGLLKKLAKRINRRGLGERSLYDFRQTYVVYPYLGREVVGFIQSDIPAKISQTVSAKLRLLTAKSQLYNNQQVEISQAASAKSEETKLETWQTSPDILFYRLSASHLIFLTKIKEPLKRAFYEQETIRGCWTVDELDRQFSSLYYERMGISKDKLAMQRYVESKENLLQPKDIIRNPVTMEFLGLDNVPMLTETKLETTILDNLQRFLLEMGNGFCFEARQKRILVDQDYFKADLVFYHRILKCHVIIDLKIDRFRHEYASQLNLYMNYFRHEVMQQDDNPPIGLLLCTDYGETTVQYATEGLSQNLFVSKYRLQLPSEDEIKKFLLENISEQDFAEYKEEGK